MKTLYSSTKISLKIIILTALALLISMCSSGSGSGSANLNPAVKAQVAAVTIDAAGVVPILGNNATNTVIYVHNNTNAAISGITYGTSDNNTANSQNALITSFLAKLGFQQHNRSSIKASSAAICSSIPAHGSCPLSFATPTPDSKLFQGSSVIIAKYVNTKGKQQTFTRSIDYATVSNSSDGVIINSGVSVVAQPGIPSYGTIYLYAGGVNQVYDIKNLSIDKPSLVITNGNIIGQSMASGSVQAVEIMVPGLTSGEMVATIRVQTSAGYSSLGRLNVQVTPTTGAAILVAGFAPIVNTASPNFIIPITNAGNQVATSIAISYPSGIAAGPAVGSQCGTTLAAYATCNLSLTVNSSAASGSGVVTVNYSYSGGSNSVSQNVIWYNTNTPLAGYVSSVYPLSFSASQSESAVITITNYGSVSLSNITLTTPQIISGAANASILGSGDSCTSATLLPNDSCSYAISISAANATSGSVVLAFSASWNNGSAQTYNRAFVIPYSASAYAPLLVVTVPSLQIVGDNVASQTVNVTVANNGPAPATITSGSLSGNPSYITTIGNCNGTLAASDTCTTPTVTLGPTVNSTTSNIVPSNVNYNVSYYGGTITSGSPATASGAVNATVTPDTQDIVLESAVATQSTSGEGESAGNPIIFSGYNTNSQYITLTYRNQGTESINISGVINANSGWAYQINKTSSTCYNSGALPSSSIAVNGTCTIVFTNVLGLNFLGLGAGLGSSYNMNLTVPTLVFYDAAGSQFSVQPTLLSPFTGSDTLYVTAQQATLTNTLSQAGVGGNVTVTNTLANAANYANITVTTNMEDYFASGSPVSSSSNCTVNNGTYAGIMTQVCTLSASTVSGNAVYTVNAAYESGSPLYESYPLDATYTINTNGQIISVSQLSSQINPLQ